VKSNPKKFHLVNWQQVIYPKDRGGLGIREPGVMNITMGAKFLWIIIIGKSTWWKSALFKKYFTSSRHRYLENPPKVDKSSSF